MSLRQGLRLPRRQGHKRCQIVLRPLSHRYQRQPHRLLHLQGQKSYPHRQRGIQVSTDLQKLYGTDQIIQRADGQKFLGFGLPRQSVLRSGRRIELGYLQVCERKFRGDFYPFREDRNKWDQHASRLQVPQK